MQPLMFAALSLQIVLAEVLKWTLVHVEGESAEAVL